MENKQIANKNVTFHHYNTVIVGSGAAGMNCAVHLYELMERKGIDNPQDRIVVVTAGLGLGASRMSGSDKQTYYKMGTSPDVPDNAEEFAKSLTAAGCCHGDTALAEAIGSLREFYHLVQVGVAFPTDTSGTFIGYKTDHDPYERATSAGPKTSKFMSECLQRHLERYGVRNPIERRQEPIPDAFLYQSLTTCIDNLFFQNLSLHTQIRASCLRNMAINERMLHCSNR